MLEWIVVVAIVLAAVLLAAWQLWRELRAGTGEPGQGCSGCGDGDCSTKQAGGNKLYQLRPLRKDE